MSFKKFYSSLLNRRLFYRFLSSDNSAEIKITEMLKKSFPKAKNISVTDISGGCGAMFEVSVESVEFKDTNKVKQHMIVNNALRDEIKDMHGIRIFTSVPESE